MKHFCLEVVLGLFTVELILDRKSCGCSSVKAMGSDLQTNHAGDCQERYQNARAICVAVQENNHAGRLLCRGTPECSHCVERTRSSVGHDVLFFAALPANSLAPCLWITHMSKVQYPAIFCSLKPYLEDKLHAGEVAAGPSGFHLGPGKA